jgi:hypothetical protein
VTTPLGSTNPDQLRSWYGAAFAPDDGGFGFLNFGGFPVLFDRRSDVSDKNPQPGRMILNFHVDDAHTTAARLDALGVSWVAELERRPDGWFGTVLDPDGNYVQIIELSAEYLERRSR